MAQDRPNAVFLGKGRDRFGFPVDVLEDTTTKARLVAYDPDVWFERAQFLRHLQELQLRGDEPEADTVQVIEVH